MKLYLFILIFQLFYHLGIGQTIPKYTWKGKEVNYNDWRDSLKIAYLNYCDSLKRIQEDSVTTSKKVFFIPVRNIQNFEHELISTNHAIRDNKIHYVDAGIAKANYLFDLEAKKMFIDEDGTHFENKIVDITSRGDTIFDVFVKFSESLYANYIYQREDDGKYMIMCRWLEGNKFKGWFDRTITDLNN